jgi:hypothetical protein
MAGPPPLKDPPWAGTWFTVSKSRRASKPQTISPVFVEYARSCPPQDPDGFFIEFSQRDPAPPTSAPASSNIIGGAFEIIVADMDQTLHIYHDGLGFQTLPPTAFDGTKLLMDTAGTLGAQYRRSSAIIPGTSVVMAFMEFKDIGRKPLHTRIQDPGTAILQVRVRDIDATVKAFESRRRRGYLQEWRARGQWKRAFLHAA